MLPQINQNIFYLKMNLKKLQDTIENLQTFDSSFFIGQSYFLPKKLTTPITTDNSLSPSIK